MLTGEVGSSDSLGSGSGVLPQGRVQGEELLGMAGRWMEAGEELPVPRAGLCLLGDVC